MNEYYPPDYDPEKLPRLKTLKNWSGQGGQGRDRIMEIRTMLPWNIRCNTCGHYMYRGTKFNSRVEAATDYPKYLEYITIRRFYIRCLNCVSNITFITDPEAIVCLPLTFGFPTIILGLCNGSGCNTTFRNQTFECDLGKRRKGETRKRC